ncbi:MAG TPA: 50S ribosomal protein L6 [Clostridiaceae bacterium]|nr:50S ribosomal protein L6 [Clostridiaceae bacterium]
MSRIGKMPVEIPPGVEAKLDGEFINIKKDKIELSQRIHPLVDVEIKDQMIVVTRKNDQKESKSLHGLTRSLINNMVQGVNEPFTKNLDVQGTGYRAQLNGNILSLTLGLSHPVEIEAPEGITFEVPAPNRIVVKGADKQLVGETAARIRAQRLPNPYKGKGIKYDYEVLRLKEGKTGAK